MSTESAAPTLLTRDQVRGTASILYDLDASTAIWKYPDGYISVIWEKRETLFAGRKVWDEEVYQAGRDVTLGAWKYDAARSGGIYSEPAFYVAVEIARREALKREAEAGEKDEALKAYLARTTRPTEPPAAAVAETPAKPKLLIQPREYQTRGLEAVRDCVKRGVRRVLLVAPTGAGKMVTAGLFMLGCADKGHPSIFVADQRELIGQCADKLKSFGVPANVLMAGSEAYKLGSNTWVASKDTLYHRAFRNSKLTPPPARMLIGDEAHKHMSSTWLKVFQHYYEKGSVIVGMTATPCRLDGRGLGDFYDELIVMATYKELRDLGFIVPCRVFAPNEIDLAGIKSMAGDYNKKQVNEKVDTAKLVGDVVRDWRKRADGRKTFVFANGVHHSVHLRNQFRRHGISAEHIDAKNTGPTERDEIMRKFTAGDVTVLCNYGIATTGVDVPDASCVVCVRPTKSFSLWRQMCGRGLRVSPETGKKDLLVIDHAGNVYRHGFPDDDVEWELSTSEELAFKKPKQDNAGRECRVCGCKFTGYVCPECGDEPPIPEPNKCPECDAAYRGPECPECGCKRSALRGKSMTMTPGELKEIERKKLNRSADPKQKEKDWKSFVGIAIKRGQSMSTAGSMYKGKYGVFPPHNFPMMPKGSSQWCMKAVTFYQKWQNHKQFGDAI